MTRHSPSSYRIEFQPQLVEEVVLRAIDGHTDENIFREERNVLYHLEDEEAREEAFQTLHQRWFERLGLSEPLQEILDHWSILKTDTQRCLLVKAPTGKETGADLFVTDEDTGDAESEIRSIVIRVTSDLVTQKEPLLAFLRRELLHVVDMLDRVFGYQPNLPKSELGPTYDRLLQERYHVLWNITIDGRLRRKGFLSPSVRESHWKIFKNVFAGPRQVLESVFSFFFNNTTPKHQELVSFSLAPQTWFIHSNLESTSRGMCPLCRFPSHHLVQAEILSAAVIHEIKKEHSRWNPAQPICQQCADLYELRPA